MGWFVSRRGAPRASRTTQRAQLSRMDRHTIFREMAKGELRRGETSKRRYRQLVRYADRLGIDPPEAVDLIADAHRALGLPVAALHAWHRDNSRWDAALSAPTWLAVSLTVMVIVVIINLLLRRGP